MIGDNGAVRVERRPYELQRFAEDEDPCAWGHFEKCDWRRNHRNCGRGCLSINRATDDRGAGMLSRNCAIGGDRCDGRV
jgi:hypothetical protein